MYESSVQLKKCLALYTVISDITIKSLKIKEAAGIRDENLSDPDSYWDWFVFSSSSKTVFGLL